MLYSKTVKIEDSIRRIRVSIIVSLVLAASITPKCFRKMNCVKTSCSEMF